MADITSKTKVKLTISYDITSAEIQKIAEIAGVSFILVPCLFNIDLHTYYQEDDTHQYSLVNCFTWGNGINSDLFNGSRPEWTYNAISEGTNTVTYETPAYDNYIKNTDSLSLTTSIKFGVYAYDKDTKAPSGTRLTTIDYSDVVTGVECYLTEVA